ncbi:hypothetical protein DR864_27350 [Runella rosea]|uniref:Uncharacterized protein n=1 Tax=Runella rosea TaxID=2259595 RepID=A0A344TRB9_9BACT|nr:hypothetical protein DR864_27350 [Runella rosea]
MLFITKLCYEKREQQIFSYVDGNVAVLPFRSPLHDCGQVLSPKLLPACEFILHILIRFYSAGSAVIQTYNF